MINMCSNRQVVAALITYKEKMALFQRSPIVSGDNGLWHCITGFLPGGAHPGQQALDEIHEEAGIPAWKLRFQASQIFHKAGKDRNVWRVHAYHYECISDEISLNWENDASDWVDVRQLHNYSTVDWLEDVLTILDMPMSGAKRGRADYVDPWSFTAGLHCAAAL